MRPKLLGPYLRRELLLARIDEARKAAATALTTRMKELAALWNTRVVKKLNALNWCGLGFCAGSLFEWASPTQKQWLQYDRSVVMDSRVGVRYPSAWKPTWKS
jgi:hypothetical protein